MTHLSILKSGDAVNLEAEVIAKYVERMMNGRMSQLAHLLAEGESAVTHQGDLSGSEITTTRAKFFEQPTPHSTCDQN